MTYFRIQQADRDAADLLNEDTWLSINWGQGSRECRGCTDCETIESYRHEQGQTCGGTHEVEMARYGVSVLDTIEDLAAYANTAGMDLWSVPMVIVELDGYPSGDDAEDAEHGESLICPTRIVNVRDVDDTFIESVYA
jgi:hypothetical protein